MIRQKALYIHACPILSFICMVCMLLISSCSLTKRVPDDQQVFMGTRFEIADEDNAQSVEFFDLAINDIPPTPTNTGIGNIYTGFYNIYERTNGKSFRKYVKNTLGSAPVIFNQEMIKNTEAKLDFYLNGKGFFGHETDCDTIGDGRKVNMVCEIKLGQRYKIDSLIFPVDTTYTALKLDQKLQRLIIKEGNYYDRDRLEYERLRLTNIAGQIGFADFGTNNVLFYVDTLAGNKKVDIYLKILQPTDSTFHKRYILDSIRIYPNYTLGSEKKDDLKRVEIRDGIYVYENEHYLDHGLIDRLILQNPGSYFNSTQESRTIARLSDLGVFSNINIEKRPNPNSSNNGLIQYMLLTPLDMQSISAELEVNNRSGNFFGTGANVKYINRNIFGHAERLDLSVRSQVETQFGGGVSFINSSDLGVDMTLEFPRFFVPFINIRESKKFIPRTQLKGSYTYQRRTGFYTIQSLSGKFGYKWRETSTKLHELFPIVLNEVNTTNKTTEFQDKLDDDPRLKAAFENILINGLQYYFTYSNQANARDRRYDFFRVELETSGNLASLFFKSDTEPAEIIGIDFAQFSKITLDFRKFWRVSKTTQLAARILTGAGFAYGNSTELPYIKQYLIGGSNSLRAFRLRGLGPGAFFSDPSTNIGSQFIDQTGDLKLEMSLEYRFHMFGYFKGATFIDAGNVWLLNNKDIPEGNFSAKDFYKEIGVGSGIGLRVDFGFFLIRLDVATPLRAPNSNNQFEWRLSDFNFGSKNWRQDNIRYNIGIGYPF